MPARNALYISQIYSIPEAILHILNDKWPVKITTDQFIKKTGEILMHQKFNANDVHQTISNIKIFINSKDFEHPCQREKIIFIKGELEYVRNSSKFAEYVQELNETLDAVLKILPKKTLNTTVSKQSESIVFNNSHSKKKTKWWPYLLMGLSLVSLASGEKKNNQKISNEDSNDLHFYETSSEIASHLIQQGLVKKILPNLFVEADALPNYLEPSYRFDHLIRLTEKNTKEAYQEILRQTEEALKTDSDDTEAMKFKINALTRLHHYQEAIPLIEVFQQTHPAEAKFFQAQVEIDKENYSHALRLLQEAHKLEPLHDYIEDGLKQTENLLDTRNTARYWIYADTSQAFKRPLHTKVLPKGFYCSNDHALMDDSCRLHPKRYQLNGAFKTASIHMQNHEYVNAAKIFHQILETLPNTDPYFNIQLGTLYLSTGECYRNLGNLDAAKKHYELYFVLHDYAPDGSVIYANYADILLRQGDYEGALIAFHKALILGTNPEDSEVIKNDYTRTAIEVNSKGKNFEKIIEQWDKESREGLTDIFKIQKEENKEISLSNTFRNFLSRQWPKLLFSFFGTVIPMTIVYYRENRAVERKAAEEQYKRQAKENMTSALLKFTLTFFTNPEWKVQNQSKQIVLSIKDIKPTLLCTEICHLQSEPTLTAIKSFSIADETFFVNELEKTLKRIYGEQAISRTLDGIVLDVYTVNPLHQKTSAEVEQIAEKEKLKLMQTLFEHSPEYQTALAKPKLEVLINRINILEPILISAKRDIDAEAGVSNFYHAADEFSNAVNNLADITEHKFQERLASMKQQFLDLAARFKTVKAANDEFFKVNAKEVEQLLSLLTKQRTAITTLLNQNIVTKEDLAKTETEIQTIADQIKNAEFKVSIQSIVKKVEELFSKLSISYQKLTEAHKEFLGQQKRIELVQQKQANKALEQQLEVAEQAPIDEEELEVEAELVEQNLTNNQNLEVKQPDINPYLTNPIFALARHCELLIENLQSPKNLDLNNPTEQHIILYGSIFNARKLAHALFELLPVKIGTSFQHMRNNLMHYPYLFDQDVDGMLFVVHRLREYCMPVFDIFNHWNVITSNQELSQLPDFKVNEAAFLTNKIKNSSLIRKADEQYLKANAKLIIEYVNLIKVIFANVTSGKRFESAATHPALFSMLKNLLSLIADHHSVSAQFSKAEQKRIQNFTKGMHILIAGKSKFKPSLIQKTLEITQEFKTYFSNKYPAATNSNNNPEATLDKIAEQLALEATTPSKKTNFHHAQFLKNLAGRSHIEFVEASRFYAQNSFEHEIIFNLELLEQYLNYAVKVLNVENPEEYVVYEHNGMLHSAMKEAITRIGQAIRDLPQEVKKDIRALIKARFPDLWLKSANKNQFEFYRDIIGHEFEREDENNNAQYIRREIYEEITPQQLIAIAKKAEQLKLVLQENFDSALNKIKVANPVVTSSVTDEKTPVSKDNQQGFITVPLAPTLFRKTSPIVERKEKEVEKEATAIISDSKNEFAVPIAK